MNIVFIPKMSLSFSILIVPFCSVENNYEDQAKDSETPVNIVFIPKMSIHFSVPFYSVTHKIIRQIKLKIEKLP